MRAYLLADEPDDGSCELEEWRAVRRGAEEALAECAAVLDPAVRPAASSLRTEVQDLLETPRLPRHRSGKGSSRRGRRLS